MSTKLCILTCHNFTREVTAYVERQALADVIVRSFESACFLRGARPEAQEDAELDALVGLVAECAGDHLNVALVGGRCLASWPELASRLNVGANGITLDEQAGAVRLSPVLPLHLPGLGETGGRAGRLMVCAATECANLALNALVVQNHTQAGAYVMTPGWLEDWEREIARAGLDRRGLRDLLGASAHRIVLLDTQVRDDAGDRLRAFADFVGLPFEIIPVGLETVGLHLTRIFQTFELCLQEDRSQADSTQANRRSADYAMMFDLISDLAGMTTEAEVVEKIFEAVTLLCVPSRLVYVPLIDGVAGDARGWPTYLGVSEATKSRLAGLANSYAWSESGKGFALRIGRQRQVVAALELDGFAYPELKRDYLNLALDIAPVLGLAIANARHFQRLGATNALLARSNAELEQFAAVVSSDLRDPLHTVTRFLDQLVEQHGPQLAPAAEELVAQASAGTRYMQQSIDDLLAYCRVDAVDQAFELVDCEMLLQQVLRNLNASMVEAAATVTSDPLPAVMGDRAQLILLFQNLIGNAIKFRGGAAPVIHIRSELQIGDEPLADGQAEFGWLFAVQDNGIGIEPAQAERIFGLFRRAAGQEMRGGTGMGLAICKKIVERHGGRIWFESTPGRGATFYFTVPAH
jgi:signal transduction histidine kinase